MSSLAMLLPVLFTEFWNLKEFLSITHIGKYHVYNHQHAH